MIADLNSNTPLIIGDTNTGDKFFSPDLQRATNMLGLDATRPEIVAKVMGLITEQDPSAYKRIDCSSNEMLGDTIYPVSKTSSAIRLVLLDDGEIDIMRNSNNNTGYLLLGEDGELQKP